ncbi:MAG: hypothetical protein ACI31V_02250 [Bacilli bacterium]
MMKKKKYITYILIFMLILKTNTVFADPIVPQLGQATAIETQGDAFAEIKDYGGNDCGDGGCVGGYSAFELRLTLLDENFQRVEGTKTVEIRPYQPARDYGPSVQNIYKENEVKYVSEENWTIKAKTNGKIGGEKTQTTTAFYNLKNTNESHITFLGSSRVKNGMLPENNVMEVHYVYMGFGDTIEEKNLTGSNTQNLVNKFTNYFKSMNKKNYVQGYGNVSLLDYFLHVSGYSDKWEVSEDEEKAKEVFSGKYTILIEPVHHPAIRINGIWYGVDGTSAQLAQFQLSNGKYRGKDNPSKGWCFYELKERAHDLMCGMMAYNSPLNKGNETAQQQKELCDKYFINAQVTKGDEEDMVRLALSVLTMGTYPYGAMTIKIQKWESEVPEKKCSIDINTCGDNNFIFNTELYAIKEDNTKSQELKDISECVYNMSDENKNKYMYSVTDAQNRKLYCYDDVTYDFSELKRLQNKTYISNNYQTIAPGQLNVNRTCFSLQKINDKSLLENILLKDNINPKQYQDEFKFTFNGANYTFKRQNEVKTTGTYSEYPIKKGMQTKYVYTSSFTYLYNIQERINTNNTSILINDYSLNTGIVSTNSINFMEKYFGLDITGANTIRIEDGEPGKYTNELKSQLNNNYGLSSKLINTLKSTPATNQTTNNNWKLSTYNIGNITVNVNEDQQNTCKFESELENPPFTPPPGGDQSAQFRVISLSNPFPARDGTSRIPGKNWLNSNENNVYDYIQNNRNVNAEEVYNKAPIYTVTLTPTTMIKIREYNKSHTYSNHDITCEKGTGRMCIDKFIRNSYVNVQGTCKTIKAEEITQINRDIKEVTRSGCYDYKYCPNLDQTKAKKLDTNKDGIIDRKDYLNAEFYKCADKTAHSGG